MVGILESTYRGAEIGLLLDDYTLAHRAYSFRLLRTAYSGDCIKVRRSSDNTTLDVGFSSGVLDVSALETFCSGTDGYLERWYDQSGNTTDAIQTTTTSQPKIVTSGSVEVMGTEPAAYFNGTNQMPITHTLVTPNAFAAVFNFDANTKAVIGNALWSSMAANKWALAQNSNSQAQYRTNGTVGLSASTDINNDNIMTLEADNSGGGSAWGNGVLGVTTTPNSTTFDSGTMLGGVIGFSRAALGHIQELVIWHNDKSTEVEQMNTDINSYYSYY